MIDIQIEINDTASPAVAQLLRGLEGDEIAKHNDAGGRAATEAARQYHNAFNKQDKWQGDRYIGGSGRGGGRAGEYGSEIAKSWFSGDGTDEGVTISNDGLGIRQKVYGGTIRPKKAKALTIPLIPGAVGVRAKDYEGNLFMLKGYKKAGGTNFLFEAYNDGIRAVYMLKKSVTQKPWPGALPEDELFVGAFTLGWLDSYEAQ